MCLLALGMRLHSPFPAPAWSKKDRVPQLFSARRWIHAAGPLLFAPNLSPVLDWPGLVLHSALCMQGKEQVLKLRWSRYSQAAGQTTLGRTMQLSGSCQRLGA